MRSVRRAPDTARFVYTPDAGHWQYLAIGETATVPTGGSTLESELIDIDGDGDLDIVTAEVGGNARIAYNNGDSNADGLRQSGVGRHEHARRSAD